LIFVRLTNGFGNNLFQYIAGRLLAEHHKKELVLISPFKDYYGLHDLNSLGLKYDSQQLGYRGNCKIVNEDNYSDVFNFKYRFRNLCLDGYFEDYNFYKINLNKIKGWFPVVNKTKDTDLVLHLRLGERLYSKQTFDENLKPRVAPSRYVNAIKSISFNRLHIITDMPEWREINVENFLLYKFHIDIEEDKKVPPEISVKYFNDLYNTLNEFNPTISGSLKSNRPVVDDFSELRSFKNIIFEHSTTAWWAAALSDAKRVGVYGPWRPFKGERNKNLSNVKLDGWFKWE
jgi:hypothetical protein